MEIETIRNYASEHNISRFELQDKISIATAETLKNDKIVRTECNRIMENLTNVLEIFKDGFSSIEEIKLYLHKETRELIEKTIELVLTDNIPIKISKFSIKNNIAAISLAIFLSICREGR